MVENNKLGKEKKKIPDKGKKKWSQHRISTGWNLKLKAINRIQIYTVSK